jgi:hypothetical protein
MREMQVSKLNGGIAAIPLDALGALRAAVGVKLSCLAI